MFALNGTFLGLINITDELLVGGAVPLISMYLAYNACMFYSILLSCVRTGLLDWTQPGMLEFSTKYNVTSHLGRLLTEEATQLFLICVSS